MSQRNAFEIVSRDENVQGERVAFFRIDRVATRVRIGAGDWGEVKAWEIVERHDEACALLYEIDTHRVILVRQFRAPLLNRIDPANPDEAFLLEPVAGMIDAGESAEAAVTRETLEETGHRLKGLERVSVFYSSPGGTSERINLFLGEVRSDDRPETGGGEAAEGEQLEIVAISPETLAAEIAAGRILDGKLLMAAPALFRALDRPLPSPSPETMLHLNGARRRVSLRLCAAPSALDATGEAASDGAATAIDRLMAPPQNGRSGGLFSWRRSDPSAGARVIHLSAMRRAVGADRTEFEAMLSRIVDCAEAAVAAGEILEIVNIGVDSVGDYQAALDALRRNSRLTVDATSAFSLLNGR